MRRTNDERLGGRQAQNLSWAAPLPDPTMLPRVGEAPRVRWEWETRDSMNNRLWADMEASGPKAVTAAALAAHPSRGAETMMPLSARQDRRTWGPDGDSVGHSYYPHGAGLERPGVPAASVFQNPSLRGYNVESGDVARELRGVVKEDTRFLGEDASVRLAGRTFDHQWITPVTAASFAATALAAGERLRPEHDDVARDYRSATGPSWRT
jgi:hypothetical protein